jgi:hypothetical protein
MKLAPLLLATLAFTASGCVDEPAPGLGWSRAPDLSVYSAMILYADVARERSVLCSNNETGWVERRWQRDYGARVEAVTSALVARHGAEAVEVAEAAAVPTRRLGCEDAYILHWRDNYERLLRLLETRLGLA